MLIHEETNGNAGKTPAMKETTRNVINNALVTRKSARNWSIIRFNGGGSALKDIESKTIESFQQIIKDRGWNVEPTNHNKLLKTVAGTLSQLNTRTSPWRIFPWAL